MSETTSEEAKNLTMIAFVLWAVMVLAVTYARNFEIVSWDEQVAKWTIVVWFGCTVGMFAFLFLDKYIEDEDASPVVSDDPKGRKVIAEESW